MIGRNFKTACKACSGTRSGWRRCAGPPARGAGDSTRRWRRPPWLRRCRKSAIRLGRPLSSGTLDNELIGQRLDGKDRMREMRLNGGKQLRLGRKAFLYAEATEIVDHNPADPVAALRQNIELGDGRFGYFAAGCI